MVLCSFSPRQTVIFHGAELEVCWGMRLRDTVTGSVQGQKKDKEPKWYSRGIRLLFQGLGILEIVWNDIKAPDSERSRLVGPSRTRVRDHNNDRTFLPSLCPSLQSCWTLIIYSLPAPENRKYSKFPQLICLFLVY